MTMPSLSAAMIGSGRNACAGTGGLRFGRARLSAVDWRAGSPGSTGEGNRGRGQLSALATRAFWRRIDAEADEEGAINGGPRAGGSRWSPGAQGSLSAPTAVMGFPSTGVCAGRAENRRREAARAVESARPGRLRPGARVGLDAQVFHKPAVLGGGLVRRWTRRGWAAPSQLPSSVRGCGTAGHPSRAALFGAPYQAWRLLLSFLCIPFGTPLRTEAPPPCRPRRRGRFESRHFCCGEKRSRMQQREPRSCSPRLI
ncbi:hypothetical protein BDY21DRAFT_111397 [Lineolata rhizophorae]|uniref:Uncharacterized protein n=1 Tax=Lineolata rhizophorae TaxID=578093 RepID=A0A6A6NS01_9PEZI|nr:hypothetical protein BDY21DRAFT_111397 [Lineolata rhizophorae]